jgi:hypothetical protein
MADCHDLFQSFFDKIRLSKTKKEYLEAAKEAIRERIIKYFKNEMKIGPPKFHVQGSFSMGTIINPLDGGYDIDDGIYLQNLNADKNKWESPETVHRWICEAVKGHTKEEPVDKNTCVRVIYAGEYHVDLPIYVVWGNVAYIAEKGTAGWHKSDPKAFTDWFKNQMSSRGDQLLRVVCYLKAWADNQPKSPKMPSGLLLTILAANQFVSAQRDDDALSKTVNAMAAYMMASNVVLNPVDSSEDIARKVSQIEMNNFKLNLKILKEQCSEAINKQEELEASKIWERVFGDRFEVAESRMQERASVLRSQASTTIIKPTKPWAI